MKLVAALSLCLLAGTARALDTDDLLDRVDTALSMAAFQDNVRLRLSGTIDFEEYHFQRPAPGLINGNIDNLFNPRLTLFLDAQVGSRVYVFVQSRLDRGFDPGNHRGAPRHGKRKRLRRVRAVGIRSPRAVVMPEQVQVPCRRA